MLNVARKTAVLFYTHTHTHTHRERCKSLHPTDITPRPESCEEGEDGDERVNEARMEAQLSRSCSPCCLVLIIHPEWDLCLSVSELPSPYTATFTRLKHSRCSVCHIQLCLIVDLIQTTTLIVLYFLSNKWKHAFRMILGFSLRLREYAETILMLMSKKSWLKALFCCFCCYKQLALMLLRTLVVTHMPAV